MLNAQQRRAAARGKARHKAELRRKKAEAKPKQKARQKAKKEKAALTPEQQAKRAEREAKKAERIAKRNPSWEYRNFFRAIGGAGRDMILKSRNPAWEYRAFFRILRKVGEKMTEDPTHEYRNFWRALGRVGRGILAKPRSVYEDFGRAVAWVARSMVRGKSVKNVGLTPSMRRMREEKQAAMQKRLFWPMKHRGEFRLGPSEDGPGEEWKFYPAKPVESPGNGKLIAPRPRMEVEEVTFTRKPSYSALFLG